MKLIGDFLWTNMDGASNYLVAWKKCLPKSKGGLEIGNLKWKKLGFGFEVVSGDSLKSKSPMGQSNQKHI